jgi:hypothetical protein
MSAGRDERQHLGRVYKSTPPEALRVLGTPQSAAHPATKASVLSARPCLPPSDDDPYANIPCTD